MVNSVYTSGFKHPCSVGAKRKRRHIVQKVPVRHFSVIITTGVLFAFMNTLGLKFHASQHLIREQPRGRLGRLSRFFRRHFAPGGPAGEVSVAGFRSR